MPATRRRTGPKGGMWGAWILVMSLFLVQMLFYTWCRVQCVRIGYEISEEGRKQQRLIALQSNYKVELARLKSPERIARIARDRLGLTLPKPEQTVTVP